MGWPQRFGFLHGHGLEAVLSPALSKHTDMVSSSDLLPYLAAVHVCDDIVCNVFAEPTKPRAGFDESMLVQGRWIQIGRVQKYQPLSAQRISSD
jgi:hypothetical protein